MTHVTNATPELNLRIGMIVSPRNGLELAAKREGLRSFNPSTRAFARLFYHRRLSLDRAELLT